MAIFISLNTILIYNFTAMGTSTTLDSSSSQLTGRTSHRMDRLAQRRRLSTNLSHHEKLCHDRSFIICSAELETKWI